MEDELALTATERVVVAKVWVEEETAMVEAAMVWVAAEKELAAARVWVEAVMAAAVVETAAAAAETAAAAAETAAAAAVWAPAVAVMAAASLLRHAETLEAGTRDTAPEERTDQCTRQCTPAEPQ